MANEALTPPTMNTKEILFENRRLFLTGEITDEVVEKLIADLMVLGGMSSDAIELYINSMGGSVDAGLALYDVMQTINVPIITYAMGQVSSMASVILVSGSYRYSFPNTTIMIHQAAGASNGCAVDVQTYADELSRINTVLVNLLHKHTKRTKKELRADIKTDCYMTAKKALKLNFIDEIVKRRHK